MKNFWITFIGTIFAASAQGTDLMSGKIADVYFKDGKRNFITALCEFGTYIGIIIASVVSKLKTRFDWNLTTFTAESA